MKRGVHSWCKDCLAEYNHTKNAEQTKEERRAVQARRQRWREDHPEATRAHYMKWAWGITPEEFQDLVAAQGGKCANPACERSAEDLDHDHSCCIGKKTCGRCIRGVLCKRCNYKLGLLERDLDLIQGLLSYRLKDTMR